jgi:hypothetical protein
VRYNAIADVPSLNGVEVVDMRRYNIPLDVDDLVRRYTGGESEKALAEALGVSRTAIRNRLLKAGLQPRGSSESAYLRMSKTTPEQRSRNAEAAHAAVRGRPKTPEFLEARAQGVEKLGASYGHVSVAELMLADMLRDAGLTVIHQKAIGPYNVDLTASSVAVEILGGGWHGAKNHGERLRYILDAGWDVVYIWVDGRRFPLAPGAAQYVIAHCEFRDGNPAAPRCYRVIRGGGEFVAEGGADGDDLPDILPASNRPDAPAGILHGFCHCGCGGRPTIPARTNVRLGQFKGVPNHYLRGHNNKVRNGNAR